MAINLQIQKKDLLLLVAVMVFLAGSVYVIAIGSGDYTLHGHDVSEIQGGAGAVGDIYLSPSLSGTSMTYSFTAQNTGSAVIIAKGDDPGSIAGVSNYALRVGGSTIDTGYSSVAPSHGGSRSFTLIGTYDVTQGSTYTVTVTASRQSVSNVKIIVMVL